ncbi:MAG: peptide chain release factor-like protein, partial [Pirellulaceae bacterium]|jgi:hypothetical protein|nr:peptide chain release factor-like protein [Pirellulaceae bacterium]
VILTHLPTGIRGEASERRSQEQNRQAAVVRLRLNLAIDVRAATGETPSERWQGRVRGGRIEISSNHDDFAAIIAEALDVLHCREWDTKSASAFLSITSSQLTKLLAREPRALAKLNDERAARGFKPLR